LTAPQFEFDSLEMPAAKTACKRFFVEIDVQRFHTLSSIQVDRKKIFHFRN